MGLLVGMPAALKDPALRTLAVFIQQEIKAGARAPCGATMPGDWLLLDRRTLSHCWTVLPG